MAISRKDVEYLGYLARIQLRAEEVERFASQLEQILGYVEKLKEVNVEGVPPTSHVLELTNVYRPDDPVPSLPSEKVLEGAPSREGPFFKVPRVIDAP